MGGLVGAGETLFDAAKSTVVLLGAGTGTLLDKSGLFGDYFAPDRQLFDQAYNGVTSFFTQDHPLDSVFANIDSRLAQGNALSNSDSLLDQFNAGRVYGGLGGEGALLVTGGADLALGAGKLAGTAGELAFNGVQASGEAFVGGLSRSTPGFASNQVGAVGDLGEIAPSSLSSSEVSAIGQTAAGGTPVSLYRAVSPAELDDILSTGTFRSAPGAFEGKQFGLSFDETLNFANKYSDIGAIVKVDIPQTTFSELDFSTSIDPFIFKSGVVTVQPGAQLQLFNATKLSLQHVY